MVERSREQIAWDSNFTNVPPHCGDVPLTAVLGGERENFSFGTGRDVASVQACLLADGETKSWLTGKSPHFDGKPPTNDRFSIVRFACCVMGI